MQHVARKVAVISTVSIMASYAFSTQYNAGARSTNSVVAASALPDIDRLIDATARQVALTPTSSSLDLLARLQLSRGRITGDAASYAAAETAASESTKIAPLNREARTIDAEVRYANHDFHGARTRAASIVALDPKELGALGVEGDAAREQGAYGLASKILADLDAIAPHVPSITVRRARFAYLSGDSKLAADLATRAERQAQNSGTLGMTQAFYPSFRGQVALDSGDYQEAAAQFRNALKLADGDRVASLGLAKTLAAQGKQRAAVKILRALTDRYPDPAALTLLGDLLQTTGDKTGAENSYALVEAVAGLAKANRQIYNRELVLFYANHDRKLGEALRLARAEIVDRKDVYGYDALAWAEFKSGHLAEAGIAATKAASLGTRDATMKYHAGMIAAAVGDTVKAKALLTDAISISPHFDVRQAPIARTTLDRLGTS